MNSLFLNIILNRVNELGKSAEERAFTCRKIIAGIINRMDTPPIPDKNLTEYQLEIRRRLREKFPDLELEIVRGDRLMINGIVITGGVIIHDSRKIKQYDFDVEHYSREIKFQYLDRVKNI